jgi:hypothetical protein
MKTFLLMCWLMCLSTLSYAHKASDSYLTLADSNTGLVTARWDIALRDLDVLLGLDTNNDRQLTWAEVLVKTNAIQQLAQSNLQLQRQQQDCTPYLFNAPLAIDSHTDGQYAVLTMTSQCATAGAWAVKYQLLANVDAGHRGIVNWQPAQQSAQTLVLSANNGFISLEKVTAQHSLLAFWRDGVAHIWAGYDHILFLLSLLLPVVLVRQHQSWQGIDDWKKALWDAASIVTAFTVAHSLTLAVAAFHWVSLPSRWVESAIAASVIVTALHNLRPVLDRWRWMLAFVFGLIHGFGFASALSDLTSGTDAQLLALVGFNLGVETGQLAIVAIFIPLAFLSRNSQYYQRGILTGGSLMIASVAGLWLCQRLFNLTLIAG